MAMDAKLMAETARAMVEPGKGLLAADESAGTAKKRFDTVNVESTEENRRAYREMLFTTPGLGDFVSGVILFDETLRQKTKDGVNFAEYLKKNAILPGIKVDAGAQDMALHPGEKVTEGLDGLAKRMDDYFKAGARFAKWREVYGITDSNPTPLGIHANAEALASYAAICQSEGIVPIVEPEVLIDGDHTMERCDEVTEAVLHAVFQALHRHKVILENIILKPSMVVPGKDRPPKATPEQVAAATVRVLLRTVPAAVPGIYFLSGGQRPEEATANLNAMNVMFPNAPWQLSFSYGRALQDPVINAWAGRAENGLAAQQAFSRRARMNGLARSGKWTADMEKAA